VAISSGQMRAARGLIGWSQAALAEAAGLSRPTIERAETKGASAETLTAIKRALEAAGVMFVPENGEGPGVRLRKGKRK